MAKTSDSVNTIDQGVNTTDTPTFTGLGDISKSTSSTGSIMLASGGNNTMTGNYNFETIC